MVTLWGHRSLWHRDWGGHGPRGVMRWDAGGSPPLTVLCHLGLTAPHGAVTRGGGRCSAPCGTVGSPFPMARRPGGVLCCAVTFRGHCSPWPWDWGGHSPTELCYLGPTAPHGAVRWGGEDGFLPQSVLCHLGVTAPRGTVTWGGSSAPHGAVTFRGHRSPWHRLGVTAPRSSAI